VSDSKGGWTNWILAECGVIILDLGDIYELGVGVESFWTSGRDGALGNFDIDLRLEKLDLDNMMEEPAKVSSGAIIVYLADGLFSSLALHYYQKKSSLFFKSIHFLPDNTLQLVYRFEERKHRKPAHRSW
jgi:hypothetical protein